MCLPTDIDTKDRALGAGLGQVLGPQLARACCLPLDARPRSGRAGAGRQQQHLLSQPPRRTHQRAHFYTQDALGLEASRPRGRSGRVGSSCALEHRPPVARPRCRPDCPVRARARAAVDAGLFALLLSLLSFSLCSLAVCLRSCSPSSRALDAPPARPRLHYRLLTLRPGAD